MLTLITKDEQIELDSSIANLLDVLRQLESDETDIYDHTDDRVAYVINELLNRLYTHNSTSHRQAIGLLESIKLKFHLDIVVPDQNQRGFELVLADTEYTYQR